jgi:hypothetical protein
MLFIYVYTTCEFNDMKKLSMNSPVVKREKQIFQNLKWTL